MFKDHTLYTKDDFTQEEIESENKLAVVVIEQGLDVCKVCGKYESELDGRCESKLTEKRRLIKEEDERSNTNS